MQKTSIHIIEAAQMGLERMTTYVSSSSKRKQIGDFIFPEDKVPPRVKNQENYKKLIAEFDKLSEAIKDALNLTIEEQKQKLKYELQKKEKGITKVEVNDKLENQGQRINQDLQEALQEVRCKYEKMLQEKTKELEILKEDLEKEKCKNRAKVEEKIKLELETPRGVEKRTNRINQELQEALIEETRTNRINQELQEALNEEKRVLLERIEELHGQKEALEMEMSKNQVDSGQNLEEVLEIRKQNQQLQEALEEAKRNLQEKMGELLDVKETLEKEKCKNIKFSEDKTEENQKRRNKTTEEYQTTGTHSLDKSGCHQTKTCILRGKMTQLYDETCKNLQTDIIKLLDTMQYNEIKKHELFRFNVASKMKSINQLLSEGNEDVEDECRKLVSFLEEERARLARLLNASVLQKNSHTQGTLQEIERIMENTELLKSEGETFQGTKENKKFLDLEHNLLSNIMKLDVMQTMEHDTVRKKKTEAITYATNCVEKLDANVIEDA